jgi:hypothetical protein
MTPSSTTYDRAFSLSPAMFLLPLLAAIFLLLNPFPALAQSRVKLDLKTKWLEKPGLTFIKNGARLILNGSEWAEVVEFGEDYALWLRDCNRIERGDSVMLTFTIELREPSLFDEAELLGSRSDTLVYPAHGEWTKEGTADAVRTVAIAEQCLTAATILAWKLDPRAGLVVQISLQAFDELMPGDAIERKMEAMVAGERVAARAKELVDEARALPSTHSSR